MQFEELIKRRYSCRKFLHKPVAREVVENILSLAQRTPSWCNCQPWQLVLLSNQATDRFRDALYLHAAAGHPVRPDFAFPEKYEGIYRERRKSCGVQLYESLCITKADHAGATAQSLENFRLFGAPHVAIITTAEALGVYGALDCGLYVQSFMLAAHNFGVDCIAQAALASYPDFLRQWLGLPVERKIVCGIAFGYADTQHPIHSYRTERASLSDVVTFVD